ncbi:hypothetical protein THTE_0394 [Thermogutta terrifontis]|uniref:Uncharacterized protein n=1 Tax=Thermogutta terrifontis TaxID=1331910 RepID=A0A286RAK5_9BACT|nr:hypothetical protein THTE_0394 [Thermogutta terrifontis]
MWRRTEALTVYFTQSAPPEPHLQNDTYFWHVPQKTQKRDDRYFADS